MDYTISIYLEKRYPIKTGKLAGKYPIKIKAYQKSNKREKYIGLDIYLTFEEFDHIWINGGGKKLRKENREIRLKLLTAETRANKIAEQMSVFDVNKFESKFKRRSSNKVNVKHHFEQIIEQNISNNKISTSESYKYTLQSITEFSEKKKKCPIDKLTFDAITVEWLKEYEKHMLDIGKSYTTIAIYARTLRAVYNKAIDSEDVKRDLYPFGKNKYTIPTTKKVKKALTAPQLKTLFDAKPLNENEEQAKAFWFFSYTCNGMNFKDIALLKHSDFKSDSFSYYRAKTFEKTAEKTTITIYLNEFSKGVIAKYGNRNKSGYVFNIVSENDNSEEQYKKIKNFTRLINDHTKRLAVRNGLPEEISTYWARHSFATNSIRKGASMEFISEALNHSDLNVTKNYFAGFEDESKKEFAKSLLDF